MMVKGRPKGSNALSLPRVPQLSVWAQCDNQNCQKWRRLPPGSVVEDSVPWFCYMNPDELRNSCEAPEESYNEDIEDYRLPEDPSVQISSDDEGTHGSWRGGAAKRGAKRKHAAGTGGGRGRGRGAARQPVVKAEPQHWAPAPAPAPGAKRQRTSRTGDDHRLAPYAADEAQPARLQSEASLPGSAQKLPRGSAKVIKAHGAFQRLLTGAGAWDAARARTQAVQVPPQHVWEGMAQFAPEAAELACHSLDIASAESYFARPGAASREAPQDAAQKTARLALTMAAAAAADSAAGTLHASTPQPSFQALQGPLPLHTLAGLPTGQAAALPGSSAVSAARHVTVGPAQGLLGSLGMPQAMPASFGTAAAAAAVQRPQQAPGTLLGSAAPLQRATAGQPVQGAAAMQSASMLRPSIPPGLGSQATGSYSMDGRAPILGTGLPSMPGHGTAQAPQWSGAAGGPGSLHRTPPPSDNKQYSSAPSHRSLAHTPGLGQPVSAIQPQRPAMAPPVLLSPGQPPASASLSNAVRHPASNNGPPGLNSQLPQKAIQQPQSAPGQRHETGNNRPGMNGHHNGDQPRNLPNGVYEKGASREGVSKEHEHARPEHGHAAAKVRPPEVEAGYS